MRFKKTIALLCVVVLGMMGASGCGSSASGNAQGSSAAAQTQESETPSQTEEQEESLADSQEAQTQESEATSTGEKTKIKVGVLQGPTGLGAAKLMERSKNGETASDYNIVLAGAPDELTGKLISGELDIASVPSNVGAVLYAKTEGKVKNIAVSTLGVLSLLQNSGEEAVTEMGQLAGKTIHSTGQGATQEYVLRYLLEKNGVTDAAIEFHAEHAELAALLLEGKVEYALLPQPFVTTVTAKSEGVQVALDITAEWEKATDGNLLAMGSIVARTEFIEAHPEALAMYLEDLKDSVDFANENVEEAATLAGNFEIIGEEIARKAIPQCNIVCLTGEEMKTSVSAYLAVLADAEPSSVGGAVPDDAFYYLP